MSKTKKPKTSIVWAEQFGVMEGIYFSSVVITCSHCGKEHPRFVITPASREEAKYSNLLEFTYDREKARFTGSLIEAIAVAVSHEPYAREVHCENAPFEHCKKVAQELLDKESEDGTNGS